MGTKLGSLGLRDEILALVLSIQPRVQTKDPGNRWDCHVSCCSW